MTKFLQVSRPRKRFELSSHNHFGPSNADTEPRAL